MKTGRINASVRRTTPIHQTASTGSAVKFGCDLDTGLVIRWNFYSQQRRELPLYNGYEVVGNVGWRISVTRTSRGNELVVTNLVIEDSGVYSCYDPSDYRGKQDFYLNVTGMLCAEWLKVKRSSTCYSAPSRHGHRRGAQVGGLHGAHQAASHVPALYLPSCSRYSFTDPERMEG